MAFARAAENRGEPIIVSRDWKISGNLAGNCCRNDALQVYGLQDRRPPIKRQKEDGLPRSLEIRLRRAGTFVVAANLLWW
jgi:hypothetical protein